MTNFTEHIVSWPQIVAESIKNYAALMKPRVLPPVYKFAPFYCIMNLLILVHTYNSYYFNPFSASNWAVDSLVHKLLFSRLISLLFTKETASNSISNLHPKWAGFNDSLAYKANLSLYLIEGSHGGMWGSEGIAPRILKHGNSFKWAIRFATPQRYPWHKSSGSGRLRRFSVNLLQVVCETMNDF